MSEPEVVQAFGAIAQSYARLGLRVFPLMPASKVPFPNTRGFKDATDDLDVVRAWWREHPTANIGIATGESSGLFVLDVDGPAGEAALAWLEADLGSLPITAEVRTHKGRHLYFRHFPGSRNTASFLGERIDTRGEGGYVVAPPSVHPDGGSYSWAPGRSPRERRRADAPEWLCKLLEKKDPTPAPSTWKPTDERTSKRARAFVLGALRREHDEVARAGSGTRNPRLSQAAYALGGYVPTGFLEEHEIRDALRSAAQACGVWAEDGERRCMDTIDRGIEAGINAPRPLPEERPQSTHYDDPAYHQDPPPIAQDVGAPAPAPPEVPFGVWVGPWAELEAMDLPEAKVLCTVGEVPIAESETLLLYGPPNVGKSLLGMQLALGVAMEGKPVLIVQGEGSKRALRERLRRLARGLAPDGIERTLPHVTITHGEFGLAEHIKLWRHTLEATKPALVMLDPMVSFFRGDENASSEMAAFLAHVAVARHMGATVVVVHHGTKLDGEGKSRERGSGALRAWCDEAIGLSEGKGGEVLADHNKSRERAKKGYQRLVWTFSDSAISCEWAEAEKQAGEKASEHKLATKLLGELEMAGGELPVSKAKALLRCNSAKMAEIITGLEAEGLLHRADGEVRDSIGRAHSARVLIKGPVPGLRCESVLGRNHWSGNPESEND